MHQQRERPPSLSRGSSSLGEAVVGKSAADLRGGLDVLGFDSWSHARFHTGGRVFKSSEMPTKVDHRTALRGANGST